MFRHPPPFILRAMERKVDEMHTMTSNTLVSVDARWKPC
jgi:hypothetical protein